MTAVSQYWRVGGTARQREEALDDSDSMEAFLAEVERRAFHIARIAIGDADEALDIVQDSMIKLVRRYATRPPAEWRPLFYRILRNRIVDQQRRQTVRNRVMAWLPRGQPDEDDFDPIAVAPAHESVEPEHQVEIGQTMSALEAAVEALPARQQQAFLLRTVEGLDVADTAHIMGCSQGSVKTHLSRAVHRLRSALGEQWP